MLATKAVRTGKLAIVVLIGQFVPPIQAQTFSLATKPPAKVESREVRINRVEHGIEPLEFKKGEAPLALDLTQIMQLANDPGLSVAVIDGFKIVWAKGYGFTEPAGTRRVTAKTLFQAASISKPVTAMGMLALVQQGELSLDEPFATLMKQLVLDRLSMEDSTYEQPLPPAWAARAATGRYTDGKPLRGSWHVYPEMAAAGLWTTPTDLAKFAIEIALSKHGRSNKVLSQRTVQEMVTAQPNTDDSGIGFGLPTQQPGVFAHNGANEGFQAVLAMNAETGQGIAIMANSDDGILVAEELRRSVAKEYAWRYPPEPRWVGDQLTLIAQLKGTDVALARFDELKADGKSPGEEALNQVGYRMLGGRSPVQSKFSPKMCGSIHNRPTPMTA